MTIILDTPSKSTKKTEIISQKPDKVEIVQTIEKQQDESCTTSSIDPGTKSVEHNNVVPTSIVIERLAQILNPQSVTGLITNQYVIIDDAFPLLHAHAYRNEILHLQQHGVLTSNHTAYVASLPTATSSPQSSTTTTTTTTPKSTITSTSSSTSVAPKITHLFAKPHIFETELFPDTLDEIPYLRQLYSHILPSLDAILADLLPSLNLYHGDSTIKVQYNSGNGAFPFHFDSPGGRDTRRVTALLYLNPDWKEEHGGHLRLQPFLKTPVRVAPLMNRLVLFRSDVVLHRVEPSVAHERVCLTMWCHGRSKDEEHDALVMKTDAGLSKLDSPSTNDLVDNADEFAEHWQSLLQSVRYQRMLSKAIYMNEWYESIGQAHDGEGEVMLKESLENDVQAICNHGGPSTISVINYLRSDALEKSSSPTTYNKRLLNPNIPSLSTKQKCLDAALICASSSSTTTTSDELTESNVTLKDASSDSLDFLDFL
jgi:Rps23 Pro-64 3,4-dihydroxylase Tpa1-like proline 4-hydroxylase